MKDIKLLQLNVTGFRSIKQISLNFDDYAGINIIRGDNGIGKTSLIESIAWCLYGVDLKGTLADQVSTWKWLRDFFTPWMGTRVMIRMTVDGKTYVICRMKKYKGETSGLKVPNGILIISEQGYNESLDKAESQKFINGLIGIDSKTFLNSILFGQRLQRFIDAKNEDKRKIFESLFDVDFIDEAAKKAKLEADNIKAKVSAYSTTISQMENTVLEKTRFLEEQQKVLEFFDNQKANDLRQAEELLGMKTAGFNQLIGTRIEKPEFDQEQYNKIYQQYSSINLEGRNADIIRMSGEHDKLVAEANSSKCYACGQHVEITQDKKNNINELYRLIDLENAVLKDETIKKAQLENKLNELNQDKASYDTKMKAYNNYSNQLTTLQNEVNLLTNQVNNIAARQKPNIDLDSIKSEILKLQSDIQDQKIFLEHEEQQFQYYNWWAKTGFGPSGMKIHILQSMLKILNNNLLQYASRFSLGITIGYDLTKVNKSLSIQVQKNGHTIDYKELSGGQKARVDVCIAFAIHDALSSSVSKFNVLFLDEFFEGLDDPGRYEVFEVLRSKSEQSTIFMITHDAALDVRNTTNIYLNFENELTTMA